MTYEPRPGDLFLTRIGGWTGAVISAGQAFAALAPSVYTHAGIVLDDGTVLAAQPHGARIDPIESIINDRPLAFLPVPEWADDRRPLIVAHARGMEGHRYGFLSYLWIGLARLGLRPAWLRRQVAGDTALICSALADRAWELAGINLFDDGRLRGEVTPGALAATGRVEHYGTGPWNALDV